MSGDDAIVRVSLSGPHTNFEDFVTRNHRKFERKLVWYMIRTQHSLNWVIQQLVTGREIDVTKSAANKPLFDEMSSRNDGQLQGQGSNSNQGNK